MSGFDIEAHHPLYDAFLPAWTLLRDSFDGEDDIKAKGVTYLPMKPGTAAIDDPAVKARAYDFYKEYAEFPDLVALTTRGAVGTILDKSANIELPKDLEPLRERATRDGLTLEALHRRIATELMLTGRYGILPGIAQDGSPYLAGYIAESIINWDETDQVADYVVLDESGQVRNRETGAWDEVKQYRECFVGDGRYAARVWSDTGTGLQPEDPVEARDRKQKPLDFLPFVFVNTSDLTPSPDDVPLFGLAKISLRIYRMDANYQSGLYMTSEPTPWVSGHFDEQDATRQPPSTIGAARLWVLPDGAQAGMLEFTGAGLSAQQKAIEDAKADAVMFGAQILTNRSNAAESGEAKRVRLDSQHSTLKGIAMTSAAGLERALKNAAIWIGANPDKVKVAPNLDFFENELSAQDVTALVAAWQSAAFSKRTLHWNLQRGGVVQEGKPFEQEQEEIAEDEPGLPVVTE
ncbi:DUF4055 domain-containing protein [Pelagibacterium sediminicola]|uniref:DUF4055 domain-containing protein n=1 Tax=Pelagibacterium sediminicola TaxID=2248761 RepID=UPI000E31817D|nr:DUF4055 domain-containing protein [Pelagibacterium sediminicola]